MKPQVEIKKLEMADPTFEAGSTKTARARLSNPTAKEFTYSVELYLGVAKVATSGVGTVTIPAGGSMDVRFNLVMPTAEGSYPVFLDVRSDTTLIAHYQATENVVIVITPKIEIISIIWE